MAKLMNTIEIESALVWLESTYPELCTRIALPEPTHEKRICHAIRIGGEKDPRRPAVLVTAGVHAREWGGPDITINFATDLLKAYRAGKGLRYGAKTFEAGQIRWIVDTLNLVVFPCVNPDGVEFSHTQTYNWRKNRNPKSFDGNVQSIGVDLNRNFDFLWDFQRFFHPKAMRPSLASDDPKLDTFHGLEPFSEPETRNVRWLMNSLPGLALYLDLHSFAGDVLRSWGDDQDQCNDPDQNFLNPEYDGQRGLKNDDYGEYLGVPDQSVSDAIAQSVSDAMRTVRGRPYKPMTAYQLYPTSGASDDYAFSRHLTEPGRSKVFAYTIEFNFVEDAPVDQSFYITADPAVLAKTMGDVIPGLIAFCLSAPLTGVTSQVATAQQSRDIVRAGSANGDGRQAWSNGKVNGSFGPPEHYNDPVAQDIGKLLVALDLASTIERPEGEALHSSILQCIESIAASARQGSQPRAPLRRTHSPTPADSE